MRRPSWRTISSNCGNKLGEPHLALSNLYPLRSIAAHHRFSGIVHSLLAADLPAGTSLRKNLPRVPLPPDPRFGRPESALPARFAIGCQGEPRRKSCPPEARRLGASTTGWPSIAGFLNTPHLPSVRRSVNENRWPGPCERWWNRGRLVIGQGGFERLCFGEAGPALDWVTAVRFAMVALPTAPHCSNGFALSDCFGSQALALRQRCLTVDGLLHEPA